uniref:Uncharacterized protein MANES_09G090000 n=1 Tax=Rhizophora mucronata TaxID=61149 RepID=A0A2P2Q4T6_RHIMU
MEHSYSPAIYVAPQPPPFPAPPRSIDLSSLRFIFGLLAVIVIPLLIYTFFFSVKCSLAPFRRRHRQDGSAGETVSSGNENPRTDSKDPVSDVKYRKQTHAKEIGNECPVCLSVFAEGEDLKQLGVCKHSFHADCINKWLNSHSNCPVCRASVAVNKRPNANNVAAARDADLHQGLPDAASLV